MDNRKSGGLVIERPITLINLSLIETEPKSNCCHYWLIDKANGPLSHAVCKFCREERNFNNSPFEYKTA
jgi:hypothetical protein